MMMMRLVLVCGLSCAVPLFLGCGGDDDGSPTDGGSSTGDSGGGSGDGGGSSSDGGGVGDDGGGPSDGGGTPGDDAGGMCPDPTDPLVSYVANDPMMCAVIDWGCTDPFQTPFENSCGCGCIIECRAETDPDVEYASMDLAECARILIACEKDEDPFSNPCGCGCVRRTMP